MPKLRNVFTTKSEKNHGGSVDLVRLVRNQSKTMNVATYNYAWLESGKAFEEHAHPDSVEYFLILAGVGEFSFDGVVEAVVKGDFIKVDQNVLRSLKNTGSELLEFTSLRVEV